MSWERERVLGTVGRKVDIALIRIAIENPFGHIAVHIVEPPRVRLLLSDLDIGIGRVVEEPTVLGELSRIIAERVRGSRPSSASVFPFGLGGQAIVATRFGAEPLAEDSSRVLGHADSRKTTFAHPKGHVGVGLGRLAYLEDICDLVTWGERKLELLATIDVEVGCQTSYASQVTSNLDIQKGET